MIVGKGGDGWGAAVTPEEYRILFGEDPPNDDAPVATSDAPPADEPRVLIDLTSDAHAPPPRFTVQPAITGEPQDRRPHWRKKRYQFPAAILLMISLLSIDNADDDPLRQSPVRDPAASTTDQP